MHNAYIFLLKKRYGYKWKDFKEKLKYYFDFSMIYIGLALVFIFHFYRDLIKNPPLILQSVGSFFALISFKLVTNIVLLMLIQYFIKGLKTPPMYFNKGDTYFLFTLPIPKKQYIFFEYIQALGKKIAITLGVLVVGLPIYPLVWDRWFAKSIQLFTLIVTTLILFQNIQWLTFQLPIKIKTAILKILRYIKIVFIIIFLVSILYMAWLFIFNTNIGSNFGLPPRINMGGPKMFSVKTSLFLLLGLTFMSSMLSIYFFAHSPLESLKESSLSYAKLQMLMSMGMTQEAKKIRKTEAKKEKRYFLSIPGYYKNTSIFLWRNASKLIKQPLEFISTYMIYLVLSISIIISTKAEAISLVFIFIALYILGQSMLSPIRKHYEESFFLSSFPVRSITILRGYILLPLIVVSILGIVFSILMGWMYKEICLAGLLILNVPFFSYYTLLAAMRNVIEEINFTLNTNKTLIKESTLLLQGATPIVFGILFLKSGIPLWVIGISTALAYLMMSKKAEADVIRPLEEVFNKYS